QPTIPPEEEPVRRIEVVPEIGAQPRHQRLPPPLHIVMARFPVEKEFAGGAPLDAGRGKKVPVLADAIAGRAAEVVEDLVARRSEGARRELQVQVDRVPEVEVLVAREPLEVL